MALERFIKWVHKSIFGCGSGGCAVASGSRGPRFHFSRWQNLYLTFNDNYIEKMKVKKKAGNGPFLQKLCYSEIKQTDWMFLIP